MQGAIPNASSVKINFGQKQSTPTPLDLGLTIDFFSPQEQALRKEFENTYKVQLPHTCIAFEFPVENNIQEAAQKIQTLGNQLITSKSQNCKCTVHHKENKVFVILEAPEFSETIQEMESQFQDLKQDAGKENNQLNLRLSSHNDMNTIWDLQVSQGYFSGWFNSLHLEFNFIKTDLISRFLTILFTTVLPFERFTSMLQSFKKLNVEFNFESGAYLQDFAKLKMKKGEANTGNKNPITDFLLTSGIQKGRCFGFNPTVFLKGDINATGLVSVIKLVIGEN